MYLNKEKIAESSKVFRLNLINAITGIKPGNLIGTKSNNGQSNLAIISSVVHLGSNPPFIGFVMRPNALVPRHTYENILENSFYTINHIHSGMIKNAHYTSGKFGKEISEFDACQLEEEYLNNFHAPFVKESRVKIGLKHIESIPISSSNTIMVVGEIVELHVPDKSLASNGYLNLESLDTIGIGGLNSYYTLEKKEEHPYVRSVENLSF